jgi:hypothetical protein
VNEYKPILWRLLWRFLIALPFFVIGIGGLAFIASPFFTLTGALIVGWPLAQLFAEPLGALFFPNKHYDQPQPIYSIPLARKQEGRYEEALTGFLEIAHGWPDQSQAWVEMLDVAITGLNDRARAEKIFQQGMAELKDEVARQYLAEMYMALKDRLKPAEPPVRAPMPIPTNRPPPT